MWTNSWILMGLVRSRYSTWTSGYGSGRVNMSGWRTFMIQGFTDSPKLSLSLGRIVNEFEPVFDFTSI